jgi:hypothetical protein
MNDVVNLLDWFHIKNEMLLSQLTIKDRIFQVKPKCFRQREEKGGGKRDRPIIRGQACIFGL